MTTIAFFDNKGGVGKTSLAYHLAWMFVDQGLRVLVVDLDPQANLSGMFLDENRLSELWPDDRPHLSILGAVEPILRGLGDIAKPHLEFPNSGLGLLVGDLGLSSFEDSLSDAWPRCLDGDERAFRVLSAFSRLIQRGISALDAEVALIDIGPNLGSINRAALIAAEHVVIPLGPDLFSLQGLRNLGPTLRKWREDWAERLRKNPEPSLELPAGTIRPIGYVVMRHSVRLDRPVKAYERWIGRMPTVYRRSVLGEGTDGAPTVADDPHCLARLKDYRSLMPLAQEANKPMFALKPADGAIGGHQHAVQECYRDFRHLAARISERCGLTFPGWSAAIA
jgi:cellulose biosynthesis protein BcsQ